LVVAGAVVMAMTRQPVEVAVVAEPQAFQQMLQAQLRLKLLLPLVVEQVMDMQVVQAIKTLVVAAVAPVV
jgi:hypothetical protein